MAAMGSWAITRAQNLAESGIQTVPPEYVRQVEKALVVQEADDPRFLVPVIDLQRFSLLPRDHLCKDQYDTISAQISRAAENWGFFQIINHGIPDSLIARVQAASRAFFQLPAEEKEAYANEAHNPIGYGSKLGYSADGEVKLEWGDYYYNLMRPLDRRDMSKWPTQLSDFTGLQLHPKIQTVPPEYVRQVEKALVVQEADDPRFLVPVIDLQRFSLLPRDHLCKDQYDIISAQISRAAENWGFFQIRNHGIPDSLIARVQAASRAFFQLPAEEKQAYANEAQNPIGYGSKLRYSADGEVKLEWGDYYYNLMRPLDRRDMSKWPTQLSDFTALQLHPNKDKLLSTVSSTGSGLQILLPGLQIRKDGAWIDVQFVPGALVVNIGDQLEILNNGKYSSIEHRSVVHKDRSRMSWAVFDAVIASRRELIDDHDHPHYTSRLLMESI